MSFQCIGQKRVSQHAGDRSQLVRCNNESDTPSNWDRPEWGYLCTACSGAPPVAYSPMTEQTNLNATQSEAREYKDQMESGFMLGMQGTREEKQDND